MFARNFARYPVPHLEVLLHFGIGYVIYISEMVKL